MRFLREPKLPFLTTAPLTDIFLLFAGLPVLWALGLDQVIWPVIMLFIFTKFYIRNRMRLTNTTALMLIFLAVSLFSSFYIVEQYRIITFLRNYSAFMSIWLMTVIVTNSVTDERQVRRLLWGMALIAFFVSLVGMLAILNIYTFSFEAPSKFIIPGSLKTYGLVQSVYMKSTSTLDYFAWQMITRPNAIFIGCTSYSVALVILIPVTYLLMGQTRGLKRSFLFVVLVMLFINLGFNISRGAILSLALAAVIYKFRKGNLFNKVTYSALFIMLSVFILAQPEVSQGIHNSVQSVLDLRGPGSQESRQSIYKATIQGFLENPFFGYGTQRDVESLGPYPIGSHSGYLGVLYKYGIFGFVLYIAILFSLFKCTIVPKQWYEASPFLYKCVNILGIAFTANAIHQLFEEPDLDMAAFHIIWLSFALLAVTYRMLKQLQPAPSGNGK